MGETPTAYRKSVLPAKLRTLPPLSTNTALVAEPSASPETRLQALTLLATSGDPQLVEIARNRALEDSDDGRGFRLGMLGGLAFLAWHLAWMRVIGDDAWLLLAGSFSLFVGLVGAGVAATSRLRVWPLAVPLLWVLSEGIRGRVPLGGFPWGDLAFGQTSTTLTPYAALGGAPAYLYVWNWATPCGS